MTAAAPTTKTINQIFDASCLNHADRPALGIAFEQPLTYSQLRERVLRLAAHFKEIGLKKGDRIAIHGENSPQWGIAYLATVRIGAVAVPILPDFTEADVKHIIADTRAKLVFTTQRQLEKLYDFNAHKLKAIISLDDAADANGILTTEKLSSILKNKSDTGGPVESVTGDDLASIIYTSGTSGHSKGVMLTHKNFCANLESAQKIVDVRPDWTFLSVLPMSHAYEFTISFLLPLKSGSRVVYAGKMPTPTILQKICKTEQPTVMAIVPMIMEKIYKKRVLTAVERNKLLKTAMKASFIRKKVYQIIGRKLLAFFGGKLQLVAIGGAALNREVANLPYDAKFPYILGYGLTETSPLLSAGPLGDPTIAIGSAGKPVKNVEIRIINPDNETCIGEILARGPNIMRGYYHNHEATEATIDKDGWFATGDLGLLDKHNNLHITGRSKSVIVLSHGENIYPETIEEKINSSLHVVESLVKEANNRIEAWVYLDYDLIDEETKGKTQKQKRDHTEDILKNLKQEINRHLPPYSQIARFVERQEPFIKTPTHKIKRYLYT